MLFLHKHLSILVLGWCAPKNSKSMEFAHSKNFDFGTCKIKIDNMSPNIRHLIQIHSNRVTNYVNLYSYILHILAKTRIV